MENERPIEKLLRRYGAKRTEDAGAPPELRHFQRRQLQAAVTRRASSSRHRRETGFWPRWRRLILIGGGVAVVGAYALVLKTSWNWSDTTKGRSLADNSQRAMERPALPKDSLGAMPAESMGESVAAAPETPAAAPAAPESKSATAVEADGSLVFVGKAAPANEAEAEALDQLGKTDSSRDAKIAGTAMPNNTARFANTIASQQQLARAGTQTTSVLNNFRMEQTGDTLRVVDEDGSTYSGSVQPATNVADLSQNLSFRLDATNKQAAVAILNNSPGYNFRVSGMNRTLQQSVVFTGNLQTTINSIGTEVRQLADKAQPKPFPALTNATITGQAVVGEKTEVEVNAAPSAP